MANLRRVEHPDVRGQAHGLDELIIRQRRVSNEESVQDASVLGLLLVGMHTQAHSLEHSGRELLVLEDLLGRMVGGLANFKLGIIGGLSGSIGDGSRNLEKLVEDAREIFIVGCDTLVLSLAIGVDQLDEHLALVGKVTVAPEQTKEAQRLSLDLVVLTTW